MNVLRMNLSAHWGRVEDPSSVRKFVAMFGRNRVDAKAKDFRAANQLYNELLDGHILVKFKHLVHENGEANLEKKLEKGDWLHIVDDLVVEVMNPARVECMREEDKELAERDLAYENATLFIQHGLVYREYTSAIKAADPGHIEKVLEM